MPRSFHTEWFKIACGPRFEMTQANLLQSFWEKIVLHLQLGNNKSFLLLIKIMSDVLYCVLLAFNLETNCVFELGFMFF